MQRSEELKNLEADVFFAPFISIITVPIAGDSLSCEVQEGFIVAKEFFVDGSIQHLKILVDHVEYLDHILTRKLDNEGRNPRMTEADNAIQVSLADEAAAMSGEKTIHHLALQRS